MRVLTWNLNAWPRGSRQETAWDLIANELKPDIAMLQEALPPVALLDARRVVYQEFGGPRRWGTAVYARDGLDIAPVQLSSSHPGAVAVADVSGPGLDCSLTVISLYGFMEPILRTRYSITTLHRLLSDLTGVLDDPARRGHIILGGDFNAALEWDKRQRYPTHDLLFRRIEAFGLESVLPYRGDPIVTWRQKRGATPWQLDHVFVSRELRRQVSDAMVESGDQIRALSDHNPIHFGLALPSA